MPASQPDAVSAVAPGQEDRRSSAAASAHPLVLGIDPGLNVCGWGLVRGGPAPTYIACGTIRPRPREPIGKRLLHLYDAVAALIAEHEPEEVAVEEQFVGALAPASALAIGQARAAAVLAAARAGLEVAFYPPASIKSAVSGYGQGDKRQVQSMVRMLLRLPGDPKPADAADALAVALAHLASRRMAALAAGREV
ncbi:MAG TPA: crossover junction endodeoxyribonuclease RuvC [Dehalococcoidia bacterium]|nr:crossover junction endodeoxyribonuclease RuvC [Dehalococcoidia bacterium]